MPTPTFSTRFVAASRDYATYTRRVPAPCFRRILTLDALPTEATLTICGLGFYELFVNGERITRGYLSPCISNPDHILYYDCYDLIPYLRAGENTIGVLLGNGMLNAIGGTVWSFDDAPWRSAPKLALDCRITLPDGKAIAFDAADGWRCTESAILLDDLRMGEWYDARLDLGSWMSSGYDDSAWRTPIEAETPRGEPCLADIDPIVVTAEKQAVSITPSCLTFEPEVHGLLPAIPPEPDERMEAGFLYDFGVNAAGVCRIHIKDAAPGQKLVLQYGEKLAPDGGLDMRGIFFLPHRYNQRDVYICRGGDETWTPAFTYHGFRYVLVSGITEAQADQDLLTYRIMNTDLRQRTAFSCSSERVMRIWDAAIVSDLANFYHFPTDCPHREKNPWTGDASLSAEQMILALTPERNWRAWLAAIRLAQRTDGSLPGVVPTDTWGYGHGPAWDNVILMLPYYAWLYRGDTTLARENAPAILRQLHYIAAHRDFDGLVSYGLGDWCAAGRGHHARAPVETTNTIVALDYCDKAAELYTAIGMHAEATYARAVRAELYAAARTHLIDPATVTARGACQTTQAMAIHYGLFTEAERPAAFARLLAFIADRGETFDCGILGLRVLFHVLAAHGRADLAYRLITQEKYPSYGYLIANGATSLWEEFAPADGQQSSLNHHFFGDVIAWFVQDLAGLRPNPYHRDPNEIRFAPRHVAGLEYAEAAYDAPAGRCAIRWQREGDAVTVTLTLPADMRGEFVADAGWQLDDGMAYCRLHGDTTLRLIRVTEHDRYARPLIGR